MLGSVRFTMMETFVYKVLMLDAEWTGTVGFGTKTNSAINCFSDEVGVVSELGDYLYLCSENFRFKIYRESRLN